MKRRGCTWVELLVLIALASAVLGGVTMAFGRMRGTILLAPLGFILGLALLISLKGAWDSRVSLPRLLRTLDRLDAEEGDVEPAIGRLKRLWVPASRLEEALLPRLDLDGPCRAHYLEVLGSRGTGRPRVEERLCRMTEEADPLAPRAREILMLWRPKAPPVG